MIYSVTGSGTLRTDEAQQRIIMEELVSAPDWKQALKVAEERVWALVVLQGQRVAVEWDFPGPQVDAKS